MSYSSKNTNYIKKEPPESHSFWRWLAALAAIVLLLLLGFVIRGCTGPDVEVEVTRIITQDKVIEVEVTKIVEAKIEVTRMVPEVFVTEIPVTHVVTETVEVEVTPRVPEIVITEVPVTRIVREVEQIEVTRIIPIPPEVTVTPGNGRGCTRFDLEIGRNKVEGTPEDGIYIMQEPSGHRLATWTAKQGWLDSGWLRDLPLSQDVVHVQVFFYPEYGTGPIPLEILNHVPNLPYGWVSNEQCHAVEIQFPE
jgi:hypothetical protein